MQFALIDHLPVAPFPLSRIGKICFTFLLVVSMPMMVLIIASLHWTRALHPVKSLALAGLGVACMAVSLLVFCHPFHLQPMDFVMHLAAIATIVALTVVVGKRWVALG